MNEEIKCYCGHTTTCDCGPLENFNSKKNLKEIKLKDPNTCEHYKEIGCIKNICDCYTLVSKQETLEKAAEKYGKLNASGRFVESKIETFMDGAKWQAEKMYSEEKVKEIFYAGFDYAEDKNGNIPNFKQYFKQFKKK
jgi:hypothetical protein